MRERTNVLVIDPQIIANAVNKNVRMAEILMTRISFNPIRIRYTGIRREKIPNHPFISFSAMKAPATPVQLLICCFCEIRSTKKRFMTLLWSAAPVKKNDTCPKSIYAPKKAVQTPVRNRVRSFFINSIKAVALLWVCFFCTVFFAI